MASSDPLGSDFLSCHSASEVGDNSIRPLSLSTTRPEEKADQDGSAKSGSGSINSGSNDMPEGNGSGGRDHLGPKPRDPATFRIMKKDQEAGDIEPQRASLDLDSSSINPGLTRHDHDVDDPETLEHWDPETAEKFQNWKKTQQIGEGSFLRKEGSSDAEE